jgi:chromosome segregation ATPase
MDQELKSLLDKRVGQRDALLLELAPLREQRDVLSANIAPFEATLHEVNNRIKALEQPVLHDLNKAIDVLTAALGDTA